MRYDLSKFPQRLKQAREKRKLSKSKLMELTGIHPSTLSRYETGESLPNTLNLIILAEILGVSLEWLCGGEYNESDI